MSTAFNDGTDLAWFDTMPGEQMALRVHSDAVGGAFTLIEAHVPAYTGPPMHYYEDGEEIPGRTPGGSSIYLLRPSANPGAVFSRGKRSASSAT